MKKTAKPANLFLPIVWLLGFSVAGVLLVMCSNILFSLSLPMGAVLKTGLIIALLMGSITLMITCIIWHRRKNFMH